MDHGHDHTHPPRASSLILVALVANSILAVAQVGFGLVFGSIALIADSVHQVTDVVGLGIALVAVRIAAVGVTRRNTWGWGRADVLGALFSSLLLLGSSAWIGVEAIRRLFDPSPIEGMGVLVVAIVGLVVNSVSAVVLARVSGSLATRAAVVHLIGDAAGSAGVLVAAVAVLTVDATWVDPAVALLIAVWVGWSGVQLLRSSSRVLMNVVPRGVEADDVLATIAEADGVESVHHLHLWETQPGELALSAHLEVEGSLPVHESQELLGVVRGLLHDRHAIDHSTLEVECHPCDDTEHGLGPAADPGADPAARADPPDPAAG